MRILVTGGAGFIGANLVRRLMVNNFVSVVDNLSRGLSDYLPEGVGLFVEDIVDTDRLTHLMSDIDVVIHLAAYGSVVDSVTDPVSNFDINVVGTFSVLEAARRANVKKFVFASTGGAIMGNTPPPVDEKSLPKPISPYGAGKLCGEAYCHAYAMSYGMNTVSLRFANVYGPYSGHKKGVITQFIKRIFQGEPLIIYGDGGSSRDYLHVNDLCRGISLAVHADLEPAGVYHLASGREISLIQLATIIKGVAAKPDHPLEFFPSRLGEVERNYARFAKAKKQLKFNPEIPFEEGIKDTYNWFLENRSSLSILNGTD